MSFLEGYVIYVTDLIQRSVVSIGILDMCNDQNHRTQVNKLAIYLLAAKRYTQV